MSFEEKSPQRSKLLIQKLNQGKIINRNCANKIGIAENEDFVLLTLCLDDFKTFYSYLGKRLICTGSNAYHLEDMEETSLEVGKKARMFKAQAFVSFLSIMRYISSNEKSTNLIEVGSFGISKPELISYINNQPDFKKVFSKLEKGMDFEKLIKQMVKKGFLFDINDRITYTDFGYSVYLELKENHKNSTAYLPC